MAAISSNALFAGIRGHVVAIDKTTGAELWRTKLKGGSFVSVILEDGKVYGATQGEVFCLDPTTGSELWRNKLPKLGLGIVSLAGAAGGNSSSAAAAEQAAQRQRQAAAAAG
jgi:hypothetical protein